jgi:hypothetical protein
VAENYRSYSVYIYGYTSFLAQALINSLVTGGIKYVTIPRDFDFEPSTQLPRNKIGTRNVLVSMAWVSNRNNDYQDAEANYFWKSHSLKIAEWCERNNFELMIPGTCLEYAEQAQSEYVRAKKMLYNEIEKRGLSVAFYWPRIFYAFSIEFKRPRVVREALIAREAGKSFELKSPNEYHDYIEIKDVAHQLKSLLDLSLSGTWDIGSGILHSNRELIESIFKIETETLIRNQEEGKSMVQDTWNSQARLTVPNHFFQIENTLRFFSRL